MSKIKLFALIFNLVFGAAYSQGPLLDMKEMPDSFFCQNLDTLQATTTPTHLILSGYLRKSKTFSLYAKAMSLLNMEGKFLPYELPLQQGKIDQSALIRFLDVFRANNSLHTVVISDPYKQILIEHLDTLTDSASALQTVNLIYKENGKIVGDNIDADAFLLGAQQEIGFEYSGHSMLFFGCGGVSSAIAFKLAPKLSKIGLVEINKEKRDKLALLLQTFYPSTSIVVFERDGPLDFSDFDIFYNGTGLGKFSNDPNSTLRSPLLKGDIIPTLGLAIDANYTPWETLFLQQMAIYGFQTVNGSSHMIAFSSLHLSKVSGKSITYSKMKNLMGS